MSAHHDLRRRTIQGLFWQFLGVGGQQVVQLATLMALTRIFTDDTGELGLFAIVLACIGAFEALTKFMGEETTIWSQHGTERRYLDTVFTVHVLRGSAITLLLCALAPAFASFFGHVEAAQHYWVTGLFLALAPNGLIDGLSSPARALKLKGLEFRRVALGEFCVALLGNALTIGLAWWWHDVWAMVVGFLATTVMRTTISYIVAPHLPRLHIDRDVFHELYHYGRGAAGAPFLLFIIFMAPAFVLGKLISDVAVAIYDYAGRLAKLPENIFLRVLAPVAVPAYAQLQRDPQKLGKAWLNAVHAYLLVGIPLSATMAWVGNALPGVVFTKQFATIGGLFSLLALHGGIAGLTAVVGPLFWAVGRPQWDRQAQFFRCVTIYGLGVPAAWYLGPLGFAGAAVVAISVALTLSLARALPFLHLTLGDLVVASRHGVLCGLALGAAFLAIDLTWTPDGLWRVVTAGALGGPTLAFLALRLLRSRRGAPPQPPPTTPEMLDPAMAGPPGI